MASGKYTYKAFISYSHRDEKWASWLHRALESYRLPRKLKGTETSRGTVPSRIKPVFRDRDELSSGADLADTVQEALSGSENLVVVCSPNSVASRWVNEEIRHFAALGRKDRIFCIITDGDPASTDPQTACFSSALAEIGMQEPLAADVRRWADGKHLSKLKLVSGMLGLPLDQLRRRDLQKRQRAWTVMAVAAIAVTAVLIMAVTALIAAQQRRDSGESLVAYKLNELRTILNVKDDPARLGRLETWDARKLSSLASDAGDGAAALVDHALNLREQGIRLWRRSELSGAMETFQDSWALLAEAYRRDDSDPSVYFELGQADFWIGQVYRDLGAIDAAEDALVSYAEITRQLIVMQPENAEWVLEMAYALSNLGSIQGVLTPSKPERALQLLQSGLEYNQIALVLDPSNEYYQSELGQSHAFLADAQLGVCDLEGAFMSRQKQVALEQEILAGDSENTDKMKRLAWAFSGLGLVQENLGDIEGAIQSYQLSLQWIEPAFQENPDNRNYRRFILDRTFHLAMLDALDGESDRARVTMDELEARWREFLGAEQQRDENTKAYGNFLLGRARLAFMDGQAEVSSHYLQRAMLTAIAVLEKLPDDRGAANLLMQAAYQSWELQSVLPGRDVLQWLPDYQSDPGRTRACLDASLAAQQAVMSGDLDRARALTSYLLDNDYTEVSFMQFCEKYALCEGR